MAKKAAVEARYLDQAEVDVYAKLKTYENRLSRWTKAKAEEIKKLMKDGYICPTGGPAVLVLVPAEGKISWKEEFQNYLTEKVFKGNEFKAAAVIAEIEANTDRGDGSVRLTKKLNDAYASAKAQEAEWETEILAGKKSA